MSWKDPWGQVFLQWCPDVMSEHVAGVITWSCQSVWLCNTRSLARHWQTHLPDATSLHPGAVPQRGTRGSYVEKPAETLRLAILLERQNPDLEDMKSNPLYSKNSVHWLKVERPLGSGLSTVLLNRNCVNLLSLELLIRKRIANTNPDQGIN